MVKYALRIGLIATSYVFIFSSTALALSAKYQQVISQDELKVAEFDVTIKGDFVRTESQMGDILLITLKNQHGSFSYRPTQNVAIKIPEASAPNFTDDIANYTDFLKARKANKIGEETIGKYPCVVYKFLDPKTQYPAKAWVWKEREFPVRIRVETPDGVTTVDFADIQIGINIPDQEFQLPESANITDFNSLAPFDQKEQ